MMSNEQTTRKPAILRIRERGSSSERLLVKLLKDRGFARAEREFASAPVRFGRPDVWAYQVPCKSYAFEVKSDIKDYALVPCWQIVKLVDFLDGWPDHAHYAVIAAHLGQKRGKTWRFHLLSGEQIAMARNALCLIREQERVWRAGGKKSRGKGDSLAEEAARLVWRLYRGGDRKALEPLGYDPEGRYLFWFKLTRAGRSNWMPGFDALSDPPATCDEADPAALVVASSAKKQGEATGPVA